MAATASSGSKPTLRGLRGSRLTGAGAPTPTPRSRGSADCRLRRAAPQTAAMPTAPDHVRIEIVDEVYVPLVRGRSATVDRRPGSLRADVPSGAGQAKACGRL
jgi:hypothetical protein